MNTDQVQDETLDKESNSPEEQSQTTADDIIQQRIDALTKGYTTTRQDLSSFKEEILSKLEELEQKRSDDYGDDWQTEKPITKQDVLEAIREYDAQKETELSQYEQKIDVQLSDLRARGAITSQEEDEFLAFAAEHEMTNLSQAAAVWQEVKEARQAKEALKTKVKGEEGSKVGTSEKTQPSEQGVSYKEIRSKGWDEF